MKEQELKDLILEQLRVQGIDPGSVCCGEEGAAQVKVVCIAPNLARSRKELAESSRDQVVMVRVDSGTVQTLDAWIEAGAADSRSEAAALFIREGLKVRASELTGLRDALADLRKAKERLSEKAKSILQT